MVSPAALREIAVAFGLGNGAVLETPSLRGEQGQVWRVDTSAGTWALKELFLREQESNAQESATFQEAAVAAGVPAPAVIRTMDGHVLLDLDDRQFRVFSWVDVLPPDAHIDPVRVGRLIAAIHRLACPGRGDVDPWYTEAVGATRWHELFGQLTAAGNPLGERLAALYDELIALEQLLETPSRIQQLHLDLWADNVRATATAELCVIDWDNAGPGDPRQELAALLFEYGCGSATRARNVYRAYVDAGGPARISRPEDFSMAIAQLAHILEYQCRNWLKATTREGRSRAQAAINEFVSRPLTRAVIDEILVALPRDFANLAQRRATYRR